MRKTLSALVLVLSTLPVQAQDSPKPDPTQLYALLDGRTIVKTDPLSVSVGKLNLQVERLLVSGISAQLGLYFTPLGATGTQSGAFHYRSYLLSNSVIISPEQPRYIAFAPQVRWYLNGGLGHGFYMQVHYRFQHSEFTHQYLYAPYKPVDNKLQYASVDYDGQATTHSYGLSIGAQWLFGRRKNIVLDWHILGTGRGYIRGRFTGSYTPAISPAEVEKAVRETLPQRANDAVFRFDETQSQVQVSNIKYVADIFDTGVSIGFRF